MFEARLFLYGDLRSNPGRPLTLPVLALDSVSDARGDAPRRRR